MENSWYFKNKSLYRNNELFLTLSTEVEKILELHDSIVILLRYDPNVGNRNIFCYDFEKALKWQVESPVEFHADNYFTSIYLKSNELYCYNINGVEYQLDKEAGIFLDSQLIK